MNKMFRSLRVRNYRLFAGGQVVSLTGTWMQRVAQDWLVLQLSHNSGTALGVATGLQFLPLLLFGLYGGVIADRYPKRKILIGTQISMGALALGLGLLDVSGLVRLWEVYLLAFLLGMAAAVDNPTRQAFVVEMVGPDDVVNAVGLNSATFNTARIIGPAIAGLLIEVLGTSPVFFANAASFAAVITSLTAMRDRDLFAHRRVERAKGQLREGLAYVRHRPGLMLPIILAGVVGTMGLNFQITLALIDKTVFHLGAGAYGLLSSALAIGSLFGALLAARRDRPGPWLLVGSALLFGLFEIASGLMPTYDALALMLLPTGAATLTFTTSANSTVQLGSDPVMRGRVMGLYMLVFAGGTPIGAPLVGWLAQVLGARSSLYIGGAASAIIALASGVMLLAWSRRPGTEASAGKGAWEAGAGAGGIPGLRVGGPSWARRRRRVPATYPALAPMGGASEGADAVSVSEVGELEQEPDDSAAAQRAAAG